jgi:hypothetical protein
MEKSKFSNINNQTERLIEMQPKLQLQLPFSKEIETHKIIIEPIPTTALHNHEYESFFTNMLFGTRIKYFLLLIFAIYFILNIFLMQGHTSEMPIVKLMPQQSYLSKHMHLHRTLFELAPLLMIVFKKEVQFWNKTDYFRYKNLIFNAKRVDGIHKSMELNWLKNFESNSGYSVCYPQIKSASEFYGFFDFIRIDSIDKYDLNYSVNPAVKGKFGVSSISNPQSLVKYGLI